MISLFLLRYCSSRRICSTRASSHQQSTPKERSASISPHYSSRRLALLHLACPGFELIRCCCVLQAQLVDELTGTTVSTGTVSGTRTRKKPDGSQFALSLVPRSQFLLFALLVLQSRICRWWLRAARPISRRFPSRTPPNMSTILRQGLGRCAVLVL